MRKITSIISALLIVSTQAIAGDAKLWQPVHPSLVTSTGERNFAPDRYTTFFLNTPALRKELFNLPEGYQSKIALELPTPTGSRQFYIWQSSMMAPGLAAKYPDIRTFTAEAVDNRQVTAKLDISPSGMHALIYDGDNTYFIDPYSNVDDGNYICYYKKDCNRVTNSTCTLLDKQAHVIEQHKQTGLKSNGTQKKKYRLALACTHEYAMAVAGPTPTKASVLAQMVLILNRVNGVYERELAATMELVSNTDTLIYLTANDPYTNNNGGLMLDENITTIDSLIGLANYDIGHVFSTGGGGIAFLASICEDYKAGGVTGLLNPIGDPFAIDYVAHEMGHQFGSDHTFNSDLGACNSNGEPSMAFEPGSGSTIMAYAGICASDNIQMNSDAYFHAASLKAIVNNITSGTGSTCPVVTPSGNIPNTYPDFTMNYSIPLWTPFELTAPQVTHATNDSLSYCWEEWDLGGFGLSWDNANSQMPYFRSFLPSTSPTRVFPTMDHILANSYFYKGERLPQTPRTLKFVLTTRDIFNGWGCTNSSYDTDTITLNAVSTGDTFRVTSQATNATWNTGSTQQITWNVAGTASAPVNATKVNIYLSVDSGRTFPYLIANGVPNNGTAAVTIPSIPASTTKARIKVKGYNNVFFQINKSNITINKVTTSIADIKSESGFSIYPNPASDKITVTSKEGINELVLMAVNGQTIKVQKTHAQRQVDMDVREISSGLYFLKIVGKNGADKTFKITKQ